MRNCDGSFFCKVDRASDSALVALQRATPNGEQVRHGYELGLGALVLFLFFWNIYRLWKRRAIISTTKQKFDS